MQPSAECAKAAQLDAIAPGHRRLDFSENGVNDFCNGALRQMRVLCINPRWESDLIMAKRPPELKVPITVSSSKLKVQPHAFAKCFARSLAT